MTNQSNSRVFFMLFLASVFLGLGLFCDNLPKIIENYMKKSIDLATNEMIKTYWAKPPIVLPSYYWLYNITNPDTRRFSNLDNLQCSEFLAGEKPAVQKVGPFLFTSSMEKRIIDVSKNNFRITYNSTRVYFPVNESDVGTHFDEPINAINVILPSIMDGVAEKMRNMDADQGRMLAITSIKLAEKFNESLVIRTTPREMLLGRKSVFLQKAMRLAETFGSSDESLGPGMRPDGLFGLVLSQNGTLSGPFEAYTGYGETADSLGNIISFMGKQRSPYYNGTCSRIQTSAGELRPFPISLNQTLEMYRPEFGRVLHLKPTGARKIREGLGIQYVFSEQDFTAPLGDPKRDCYCVNGTSDNYCSLNGAIELGPTAQFAPLVFTTSIHEVDERIKSSLANWSPELVASNVESVPDSDKECQFLILRSLGIPIQADFTGTIFLKIKRNSKTKSMTNIPEVSYIPVVTQRDRIIVPEAFLATLVHVNTLIELTKHMKVVFYVSAIFLLVPLTNIYYRQASLVDHEIGQQQQNNNNSGSEGGAFVQISGQGDVAGGANGNANQAASTNPFVVPVNIGANLTPQLGINQEKKSGNNNFDASLSPPSINQVACATTVTNEDDYLRLERQVQTAALLGNVAVAPKNTQLNHNLLLSNNQAQFYQDSKQQQQPARFFSKLDELRNPAGIAQPEAVAAASVAPVSSQPRSSLAPQNDTADPNTNKRGIARQVSLATPDQQQRANDNQFARDSLACQTPRGLRGAISPQSDSSERGQVAASENDHELGEHGDTEQCGAGAGRKLRRNWFVKVYTDVVKVLADIKKSISVASQLNVDEKSDEHDKQLEILADRIDTWYENNNTAGPAAGPSQANENAASAAVLQPDKEAPATSGAAADTEPEALDSEATTKLVDDETQTSSQDTTQQENEQNEPEEESDVSGHAIVSNEGRANKAEISSASATATAGDLAEAAESDSPVKSLEESALGLSVDAESTTTEVDSQDKAAALHNLEQTIDKLDQADADLVDLSSLQDAPRQQEQKSSAPIETTLEAKSNYGDTSERASKHESEGCSLKDAESHLVARENSNDDNDNDDHINITADVNGYALAQSNQSESRINAANNDDDEHLATRNDDGIIISSQVESDRPEVTETNKGDKRSDDQKLDEAYFGGSENANYEHARTNNIREATAASRSHDRLTEKSGQPKQDTRGSLGSYRQIELARLDKARGNTKQQQEKRNNEIMSVLNVDGDFLVGGHEGFEAPLDKLRNSHPSTMLLQAAQAS